MLFELRQHLLSELRRHAAARGRPLRSGCGLVVWVELAVSEMGTVQGLVNRAAVYRVCLINVE